MAGIFYVLLSLIVLLNKGPTVMCLATLGWGGGGGGGYCHGQPAWCLLHVILEPVTAGYTFRAKAAG